MKPIDQRAIDQLFVEAQTCHVWLGKKVAESVLHQLYDLVKWCPTCVNGAPARFLFVQSTAEKEKIVSCLMPKNVEKTRQAPVTVVIAEDLDWHEKLPQLMPHADYYSHFASNSMLSEKTCFRNSSLQGAYLILAARALGLDCGPMSGFDSEKLDNLFFAGTRWRTNFLCNLGYGDSTGKYPRSPRLQFDDACRLI
jgi:3-hydroxypropanoate dehydrogenase